MLNSNIKCCLRAAFLFLDIIEYSDEIYKKLLGEEFDPEFRKTDYAPWSADDAYYLYHEDLGGHQFILCYDGRIVYLSSQEPFTPEHMDKVARIQGK